VRRIAGSLWKRVACSFPAAPKLHKARGLMQVGGVSRVSYCSFAVPGWRIDSRYCKREKGMPNGWSFDWASMATRERESLETCCVESLLVVYVLCVVLLSVIDAKRQFLCL
jgi:hypothetical protein